MRSPLLEIDNLPLPVLTVARLKAFYTMVSQMLVAMKREIPEPITQYDTRLLCIEPTSASVDSSWTEGLPHNGLADVGGDEEGNTRAHNTV